MSSLLILALILLTTCYNISTILPLYCIYVNLWFSRFCTVEDLHDRNIVLLQTTVQREMLDITTDMKWR